MKKFAKNLILVLNFILLICILCTSCMSKEARIRREFQNTEAKEMKLAIWSPPNAEKYETDEALEQICQGLADMGINYVYNENEWGEVTLNRIMDCYEKYGLKAIIGLPINDEDRAMDLVSATMNHQACWGFNLKDEPATEEFDHLQEMAVAIRAELPEGKMLTTNLLPNIAFTWDGYENISLEAYRNHVRDYIICTEPDTLSFDCYPLGQDTVIDDVEMVFYLKNLLEFNIQCWEAGVESSSIIQSAKWEDHRMPDETELEFLVNLNLVSGMDGITYFLYWTNIDYSTGEPIYEGLMGYDGTPNPLYYETQRINEGLGKMKGVFLDYDQVGYIFTNAPRAYREFDSDVVEESVVRENFGPVKYVGSNGSVLSGCFADDNGKKALYVMNFSMEQGEKEKVTLGFSEKISYKVWNFNGLADMDKGEELVLELAPGEAAFVEFE